MLAAVAPNEAMLMFSAKTVVVNDATVEPYKALIEINRLPVGYKSKNNSESRDEDSCDGGDCTVVGLKKLDDTPKYSDHRSKWIPIGFLIAFLAAPIVAWLVIRNMPDA